MANCTTCYGVEGKGVTAPALGNQSALAHNTDEFIRHAIQNGRQDTPMQPFKYKLSSQDINNITAFLRSKALGWKEERTILKALPTPEQYVINKNSEDPNFYLQDGMSVPLYPKKDAIPKAPKMNVSVNSTVVSV